VVVGFRDETGNTLSIPRFNVNGTQRTETGKTALSASAYGYWNIRDALQPQVEVHAPPGDYTLYNIRFQATDGTNLSFPGFPITFECGVRKGVPISGKPEILVVQPPAYYLTNALSVIVSGTASDDNGIAGMTINNNLLDFIPTGNPDNEVSFTYDLPLDNGDNIIVTTATDVDGNESFDERPVYVDRWQPSVTIVTPSDGAIFADPLATVDIEVQGSDQGYGFTIKLYYDGTLISEATGPANQMLEESITLSETLEPMAVGTHSLLAEIMDEAGNSASHSITISTNTVPVANDDDYTTPEDELLNVAAPGVLINDTDADDHSLSATVSAQPNHGTLTLNPDGSFSYTPNPDFNGTDSFGYSVDDGFGGSATATVTLTITPVNDPPVANEDSHSTDEDEPLSVPAPTGVLFNDEDAERDSLTSTLVAEPANGSLTLNADGSFSYTPNQDFNGTDSFSYQASDAELQSNIATVTITVNPVNDPPVVTIGTDSQTVQYSDRIQTVTISAVDIDSATLTLTSSDLPSSLSTAGGCTASGDGTNCSWTLNGQTLVGAGSYPNSFAVNDGEYSPSVSTELIVVQEDASAVFNDANPASIRVASDGGNSGLFTMVVHVTEIQPDLPPELAMPGDITLANAGMSLVPVGAGGSISGSCLPDDSITGVRTVTCSFNGVPVETYTVAVTISGDYYIGSAENVLTVYDPSLGFTTGGGWFYWPGTSEKTNFGYTMKYGKNGKNVKGNLLMIRHLPNDQQYRIKSNSLDGLAIGQGTNPVSGESYGTASFSGKATYLEPGMLEAEGNHGFTVYVEDHNEPGSGHDRVWITIRAKDGSSIPAMSLTEPASVNAVMLGGGNIVAPH
jgi:VCBS repeat-containing protein